ncbi:MAG: Restriction endonuclease [Candidatus Moranbacteria bacterium GW2011_GWE1_35_17]|nr:MAG: Restriction endonuclease [Candidatus Moranbacteria bacterium GW2011_GWE1_35_17]KKP83674.1 MAG: Restriction endonuclease [Candidatus Moranbacteria bacterium GW2011_GWF1_35_5]
MKLQFDSKQQYQIDAVNSVTSLFNGQPLNKGDFELEIEKNSGQMIIDGGFVVGNNLLLKEEEIIKNLHIVQEQNKLEKADAENLNTRFGTFKYGERRYGESSQKLKDGLNFSIEMETGTGKTYVYLRTIHELYKKYGFKKFIIVVPSVAIKEGVIKNLEITKEHFNILYDNPEMDFYVYDPKKRGLLKNFATTNSLQILVINIDSFAKFSQEKKKGNIIYQKSDWGVPIEYIQAVKPIVIVDEPQNMETEIRKKAITNLHPLCTLRYSATHKHHYNLIYKLDPVRAYDLGLVKKIEVDSVLEENNQNDPYIELESVASQKNAICVKLKIDVNEKTGIKRKTVTIKKSSRTRTECDLHKLSGEREIYKDYIVDAVDITAQSITFSNGKTIFVGESWGGFKEDIMKLQIRQTIINHFEKEKKLKDKGIKVLSLFFIDRVANYREYADSIVKKGKIAEWFEEIFNEVKANPIFAGITLNSAEEVHGGYFSQDKKGQLKDTKGDSILDNDTYSLIMKDKERLLSSKEPLRFIFSHSALREGWDNPNVFQICTLNETQSEIKKRQEIGRGLRLPVNQDGQRIFDDNINTLTVIANEKYEDFAKKLQTEIEDDCNVEFGGRINNKRKEVKIKLTKAYKLSEDFKELWEKIKQKTQYQVEYKTDDLVKIAGKELSNISISAPKIVSLKAKIGITDEGVTTELANVSEKKIEYGKYVAIPDVLGYIQNKTKLTKDTILKIIKESGKGSEMDKNPQQFMDYATIIINEALKKLMIDGIKYEKLKGENSCYAMELFENEELNSYLDNVVKVQNEEKTLYSHVLVDAHSSVETQFAKDLETLEKVKFYFKLPYWFKIQTPIGSYNPDWAIVLENDKKIYFVAETKSGGEIRESESAKIKCGRKHFEQLDNVRFERVEKVIEIMS